MRPRPAKFRSSGTARRRRLGSGLVVAAVALGAAGCADSDSRWVQLNTDVPLSDDPGEAADPGPAADLGEGDLSVSVGDAEHHHDHGDTEALDGLGDLAMLNASNERVPDLDMIDVGSGATVNLLSLVDHEKPLVFWFWAPH